MASPFVLSDKAIVDTKKRRHYNGFDTVLGPDADQVSRAALPVALRPSFRERDVTRSENSRVMRRPCRCAREPPRPFDRQQKKHGLKRFLAVLRPTVALKFAGLPRAP